MPGIVTEPIIVLVYYYDKRPTSDSICNIIHVF